MASSSLPSSIVNLVKAIFGVGIVSLPHFFAQTGLLLGILVLTCCAAANAFALHLISLCVMKANARGQEASFQSLAKAAFGGHRLATALVPLGIVVEGYGIAAAFFICIGDLLPEVTAYFGFNSSPWNSRAFWITLIGWGIELPLSFLSRMDSLKFSSIMGNIGIAYIVFLFCVFASGLIELPPVEQDVTLWPPPHTEFTTRPGMLEAVPIFIFVYICSLNMPTLVLELKDITVRRIDTVIVTAVVIVSSVYILVGVCGSWIFGASVDGNSLKSFPNARGTIGGNLAIFARVGVVLNLMGSIPLYLHPMRAATSQLLYNKSVSDLRLPIRIAITLVLFILTWGLALVARSLDLMMAFVGSTAHMINGFILPALFYLLYFLGTKSEGEDNVGVSLQARTLVAAETNDSTPSSFSQRTTSVRVSAWVMVIVSLVLTPVLLGGEVYKVMHEH